MKLNTFEIASSGKTDVNKLTDRLVRLLSYNESAERAAEKDAY
jgi:hypothetical protein